MKTVVNLNDEERLFIKRLLSETREQFAQAFRDLAKSDTKKDRRKFIAYSITLAELVTPKLSQKDFDMLVARVEEGGEK